MISPASTALIGATKRRAGIWAGVCIAAFAATLIALLGVTGLGRFFLTIYVAPLLAFLVAIVQSYRNGSVALSWLIASAPFWALLTNRLVRFHQLPDSASVVGYLITALFLGTTAHLFGMEVARARNGVPRMTSQTEQRVLLVVLLVTGGLFTRYYVIPRF